MKSLSSVQDIDAKQIGATPYDVALFSSGFETRGRYLASRFNRNSPKKVIVLGFENERTHPNRLENDKAFLKLLNAEPTVVSALDDSFVLESLRSCASPKSEVIRIFVDISSMSRIWYAAVLNWARFAAPGKLVEVDFGYCSAKPQKIYAHRVISNVRAIPGCEGYPGPREKLTAFFGLGRDGLAPLALLDDMEPDDVLGFAVSSTKAGDVDGFTKQANKALLEACRECIPFPLLSVQKTYVGLLEMVSVFLDAGNVVIIPLGPKSHVLSALLVSVRKPEVGCLHISGKSTQIVDALPSGDVVVARVRFTE